MFPEWFAILGGSYVFLDMGPSILLLVFSFFFVFFFLGALVYLQLGGFNQIFSFFLLLHQS
jgi:hypothetical protein